MCNANCLGWLVQLYLSLDFYSKYPIKGTQSLWGRVHFSHIVIWFRPRRLTVFKIGISVILHPVFSCVILLYFCSFLFFIRPFFSIFPCSVTLLFYFYLSTLVFVFFIFFSIVSLSLPFYFWCVFIWTNSKLFRSWYSFFLVPSGCRWGRLVRCYLFRISMCWPFVE